jgi:acyl carrier protein
MGRVGGKMMSNVNVAGVLEAIDSLDSEVVAADLDLDADLVGQGFDSLDFMSLLFRLEQKYSVKLSNTMDIATEWNTVNKIVAQLARLAG